MADCVRIFPLLTDTNLSWVVELPCLLDGIEVPLAFRVLSYVLLFQVVDLRLDRRNPGVPFGERLHHFIHSPHGVRSRAERFSRWISASASSFCCWDVLGK